MTSEYDENDPREAHKRAKLRKALASRGLLDDDAEATIKLPAFDDPEKYEFDFAATARPTRWRAHVRRERRTYSREVRKRDVLGGGAYMEELVIWTPPVGARRATIDVESRPRPTRAPRRLRGWPDNECPPLSWRGWAHVDEERESGQRGLWPYVARVATWEDEAIVPEPLGAELTDAQRDVESSMGIEPNFGRASRMGEAATDERARTRGESLGLEDEEVRLRAGDDVSGWHVAWREPTGFPTGRPRIDISNDASERVRRDVGFSQEAFDQIAKRVARGAKSVAQIADEKRLGRALNAFLAGGGNVKSIEAAYGTYRKRIRELRKLARD